MLDSRDARVAQCWTVETGDDRMAQCWRCQALLVFQQPVKNTQQLGKRSTKFLFKVVKCIITWPKLTSIAFIM